MKANNREYSRLQYRIAKNKDGTLSSPKIWLMTKTLHKICQIHPYEEFSVTAKFNEANTCSLTLYQTNNGIELPYWDRIKDLSVILVEGFGLFEIKVSVTENETAAKKITGQSLQECELGQILGSWEVNTAEDIENKKNYQDTATVFYRDFSGTMNEKEEEERLNTSLIHRILSYAPHYEIGHIDESLWDINRKFSASNTSIYDFLQTVSNEVGCIFLFDPFSRTVNVFDMEDHCTNPSCTDRRHIFGGVCQGCKSSEYIEKGYGKDITTYIDTSNIAAELEDTVNADGIKNCIQVVGGDDAITNQIGQRLIGNSSCIWTFSDEQIEEMSQPLQEKWKGYADFISSYRADINASYQDKFNAYWDEYNQLVKKKLDEESGKMPIIETINQYQTDDQAKICEEIYKTITSQITYACITNPITALSTLSKNILSYAKLHLPPGYQVEFQKIDGKDDVTCERGSDGAITTWHGKLYVYLLDAVDEKTGENKYYHSPTVYWDLPVEPGYNVLVKNENGDDCFSHSYYKWMKQQLDLQLQDNNKNRFQPKYDSDYGDDVSNPSDQPDYYTNYFSAYGRNRLKSFDDAYTKCSIMMEEMAQEYGQSLVQKNFHYILEDGSESSKPMFDQLMEKYTAFRDYIAILIEDSQKIIDDYVARMEKLKEKIAEINNICSPETYFGDLYKELMMFKREDVYENSNFTSEVPDEELMDTIENLILNAKQEAAKSCQSNHNVTLSLGNILTANSFSDQIDHISLGNYIRTRVQGTLTKMRIIEMSYHFDNMESSEITFSDAIVGYQPIKEVRDKLDKAASMATSFDFVARQSTRNDKQVSKFNEMFHDGLNAANTLIKSNDKEEFVIDNYGILGRQWDRDADMYDNCQLRITHNIIGYTKDNWNTVSMAIGKIMWNNEPLYGVIADALIGKMLIGETLEISNENNTYTMDGMGFRIQNGENKIEMNAEKTEFTIEKGEKKMLSYSPEGGLHIIGGGKFTGEIEVGKNFKVTPDGEMTCIRGNFTGFINGSTITGSKIEIGEKKFLVDKEGNAIVNVIGGNININTEYGKGNQVRLNYKVENSPDHLTLKTSIMKEDIIGVEREYQTLGETLKPGIYLEMETANNNPGLYAATLIPGNDSALIKLEGRIKFQGRYDTQNPNRLYEFGYFSSDAPFYAPNIEKGSVTIHISSPEQRFYSDVKLNMPIAPKVLVTPITDNPVTVNTSVTDITKEGFKICAYRADTSGDLEVHWIAMY